jgi:hypothetical protein
MEGEIGEDGLTPSPRNMLGESSSDQGPGSYAELSNYTKMISQWSYDRIYGDVDTYFPS